MADENEEIVDQTTTQTADEETNTEIEAEGIDYEKEFETAVENFDRAEKNREGYLKRKGTEEEETTQPDVSALVAEELKRQLPKLQASLVEDNVESVLADIALNDAEAKLIRFHFENSVGLNGTIRERLENAKLIANKKTILKTQKEMAVALQNRQGISNSGQGTSTEGMEVKDSFFSKEQLADLRAKGFDDAKIERLKTNMRNK